MSRADRTPWEGCGTCLLRVRDFSSAENALALISVHSSPQRHACRRHAPFAFTSPLDHSIQMPSLISFPETIADALPAVRVLSLSSRKSLGSTSHWNQTSVHNQLLEALKLRGKHKRRHPGPGLDNDGLDDCRNSLSYHPGRSTLGGMTTPNPSSTSQSVWQAHPLPSEARSFSLYGHPTPPVDDMGVGQPTAFPRPQQRAHRRPLGTHPPNSRTKKERERAQSYSSVIHREGRFRSVALKLRHPARQVLETAQHATIVTTSALLACDTAAPPPPGPVLHHRLPLYGRNFRQIHSSLNSIGSAIVDVALLDRNHSVRIQSCLDHL